MYTEIDSIERLDQHLARAGHLCCVIVQGLDLRTYTDDLMAVSAADSVFLGCQLEAAASDHVLATGGLLFPRLRDLPFSAYRPTLYSPEELAAGYVDGDPGSWSESLDQRIYRYYDGVRQQPGATPILDAFAQRLHDHAIDDALYDLLHSTNEQSQPSDPHSKDLQPSDLHLQPNEHSRPVVAIMGGHAMRRTDADYRKIVLLARQISRRLPHLLLASGGGPGAMEACHLGAWLADESIDDVDRALAMLAPAPTYRDAEWVDTARAVRRQFRRPRQSLGVPTWFYGHEPPNLFATDIAKYFSNSLREDGLLAIATHGVIFAPGSAGTIQEIFMDAAQNHYGTFGVVSPMIFLDHQYWTVRKPIYPLLEGLAADRQYGELMTLVDEIDAVVDFLTNHEPRAYEG